MNKNTWFIYFTALFHNFLFLILFLLFIPSVVSNSGIPWTTARQTSLSFTFYWACSNSCPLSQWCLPTISSSILTFSSSLQSFPAPGSFLMNQLFVSDGQSIGASASTSVILMIIQDWFPLGLTGLISLPSKRISSVFSSTTVQKHQFFSLQPSLWHNSYIHTWLLEKP